MTENENKTINKDKDFGDYGQGYEEKPQEGQLLESKPMDLPQLAPKPGFKTSQGQLTAVFGLVAFLASAFGFKYSSGDVSNLYAMIENLVTILGPLLAFVPVLINYINSRGKIQSNALWASASLSTGVGQTGTHSPGQPLGIAGGIGDLLGGRNWKSPERYLNIAKIGSKFVPGLGNVVDAVSENREQSEFNNNVSEALTGLIENQEALDAKLDKILARLPN